MYSLACAEGQLYYLLILSCVLFVVTSAAVSYTCCWVKPLLHSFSDTVMTKYHSEDKLITQEPTA